MFNDSRRAHARLDSFLAEIVRAPFDGLSWTRRGRGSIVPRPWPIGKTMIRSALRVTRARVSAQRGLTLVEMMITVSVLVIVLLATFALLDSSRETASKEQQRSDSIREARTGLQRMAKELRAAYAIQSLSSTSIAFYVRCGASETCTSGGLRARSRLITYNCNTSCMRGESVTPLSTTGNPCCTIPTADQPV